MPVIRRPAGDLWPHLVRALTWQPILLGGAVAAGLARRGFQAQEQTLAAVAVALGASFVLDDPAASTLASLPSPLWWRRAMRLALVLPMAAATWLVVGYVAHLRPGATVAAGLEAATLLAVVLGSAAAWARQSGDGVGGVAAAPALLILIAALTTLTPRWPVYPVADHEGSWALLLGAAVLVLLASSRDPVARPLLASRRERRLMTTPTTSRENR